jgi:hypothetical protein
LTGEPGSSLQLYFRQVEKKVNITHHSNGTLSYRRIKFWYFDLSLSAGNLTDTVTTLNMPAVGAAEFAKGDFLSEFGVSDMLATIEVMHRKALLPKISVISSRPNYL